MLRKEGKENKTKGFAAIAQPNGSIDLECPNGLGGCYKIPADNPLDIIWGLVLHPN